MNPAMSALLALRKLDGSGPKIPCSVRDLGRLHCKRLFPEDARTASSLKQTGTINFHKTAGRLQGASACRARTAWPRVARQPKWHANERARLDLRQN